jgi:hypothetical protein
MSIFALVLVAQGFTISASQAAPASKEKKTLVREPDEATASWSRTPKKYGVGIAAVERLTGTTTALTGSVQFSQDDLFQAFFGIGGTNGAFQFGIAGLYKHTVTEAESVGFHVGGGFGVANVVSSVTVGATTVSSDKMAFALTAIGGIHFSLPQVSRLKFSVDAGPILTISDNVTDFSIQALSPALGLSVIYQF